MVAERDRVRTPREELVGELRRDSDTVRDVLAVDDADVDVQLVAQRAQTFFDRAASRDADDICDEEDSQGSVSVAAGWSTIET